MDSNNNSTGAGNGGGGDGGDNGVVNWVALVVSLVALLGTVAQVLQQYIASATGYSNCDETVMGNWHKSKKRKFRSTELRFEVQFETPVIFVCPPSNTKGPIKNKPICFVDGSKESLEKTLTLLPKDEEAQRQSLQDSGVHTADNERASWVLLLSQLQSMEKDSHEWQQQHYNGGAPRPVALAGFDRHTLAVAIQAKKRSWDTMPAGVVKPYATTAMCHLLEIAAMMGIHWKEFDRSRDRYRAEGNGYMLIGSDVADLGVMFTFRICGKSRFQDNRVIPVDEVKELCCGFVSTLFQGGPKDMRRLEFPNEDPKDLSFLQLGSMDEIAETMVLIGCNTDTANYFRNPTAKHGHLFPVPFELLGMLGKTLHIRDSAFRMLPNPTPYHWDKNFFNLRRLVREYGKKIGDTDSDLPLIPQIERLTNDAVALTKALDLDKNSTTPGYSMPLLSLLHDVLDKCDKVLRAADPDLLRMVVREHFQEVLKLINDKSGVEVEVDNKSITSDKQPAEHFDELTAASPETRQEAFMELYFFKVLTQVRERAVLSYARRRTTQYAPSLRSRAPSVDSTHEPKLASPPLSAAATATTPASRPVSPAPPAQHPPQPPQSPLPPQLKTGDSHHSVPALQVQAPDREPQEYRGEDATTTLEEDASAVWCTLVLRMLCWLLLHDFHKRDVQIAKSELLGSRLPVYIA